MVPLRGVDMSVCLFVTSCRLGVWARLRRLDICISSFSPLERMCRRRDVYRRVDGMNVKS